MGLTTITLSNEQATALRARAAAEGPTLEQWLAKLTEEKTEEEPLQAAADIILRRMRNIPPEIAASMPRDGASQHNHYIYGWPKTEG